MGIGSMYGPDATFVGVPAADLDDPASFAGAAAVIVGAPFDGGTSHRPGCRFGPQAIRLACYLEHDGRRPSLALGVDGLLDLGVVDAGDVLMPAGEIEASLLRLEQAVELVARIGTGHGHAGARRPHRPPTARRRAPRRQGGTAGRGGGRRGVATVRPR